MVLLNCPLCCNETFSTPMSLKCHLLQILENLACPTCSKKFENLLDLANHLKSNCEETLQVCKIEVENAEQDKDEKNITECQYYCQMCDVDFDDIDEHLRNCHEGQEIIMEEQEESNENQLEEDTIFIINTDDVSGASVANKLAPNTQENITDKDGRFYTRKIVKIDKFWLQNDATDISDETLGENIIELKKCTKCDLLFDSLDAYKIHACGKGDSAKKRTQTSTGPHNCDICNTNFPTFKSLHLHRRMHEPIKTREIEAPANHVAGDVRQMFVCKICNKSYDKEYETVHMHSHSGAGHNCNKCNRKFFTETNLHMHMKAHSSNKKFTCSYCKKPFVTYDALNDHILNQCQKRPYACQFCGRRFARPHEKVKHERIHTGEKPHVCDICGKSFRVSYCLTLHLRTHSGTRPYQCKHCGKRFKSHSVYNHHLLTHSDVRAYKCPYCPKAFKTSVQLAGHRNSHIKPFTCTECNRPFSSLYAVRAHMETHKKSNNLKHECWMCGALYSRAFALKDHVKQQHQQAVGEKARAEVVGVDEEMEAANSILMNNEEIILGLDTSNIKIIEHEVE